MQYDFNEPVFRADNNSVKYDEMKPHFGRNDLIPMWIADMDLKVAAPITEAIEKRNQQAVFGYTSKPQSYYDAVHDWQKRKNAWDYDSSLTAFCPGIVPGISSVVRLFSEPGDRILFCTPVYSEFFDSVEGQGRIPLTVSLKEKDGYYTMDWDAFEAAAQKHPPLFILCNPHNPCGRSWTLDELKRIGEICCRNHILIFSDEIHSDLILYGNRHIPMATVSPETAANTITGISASKTFNLAGLQSSTIIFPDAGKKDTFEKFWKSFDIHRNNCFSLVATEAAFRYGEEWLLQLIRHLEGNINFTEKYLTENIPKIRFRKPEATYLLWLDCRALKLSGDQLKYFMVNQAGLALSDGRAFGKDGEGFARMNIACPRQTIEKALFQLKNAVDQI